MVLPSSLLTPSVGLEIWSFLIASSDVVMKGSWICEKDKCRGRKAERDGEGAGVVEGLSIGLCWNRSNLTLRLEDRGSKQGTDQPGHRALTNSW